MKKNFVLIAALIAALTVAFVSCGDDGVVSGTGEKTYAIELFATVTGIKDKAIIGAQGKAAFDDANGIINFSDTSGSALFSIAVKDAKADSTITIKYFCKSISGSPELILKDITDGTWSKDAAGANDGGVYPTFKVGEEAEFVLKASAYTDPTKGIGFQRNHDSSNAFLIKIISVTVK